MSRRLPGVLGSFDQLDAALEAMKALRKAGYRDLTILSPVWCHELEELLDPAASPVRYFTLLGGVIGCASGFVLTIWTSLDWPLRTGAKPIVSIPPFIIIAFELAILLGALGTLLGLLVMARLPRAPVKVAYDPQLTEDRFGILVRCPEPQAKAVQDTLKSCGAGEVRFEPGSPSFWLILILGSLLGMTPSMAQGWPWNTDMFDQPSVKPQEQPRQPPAQSIPQQGRERVLDRTTADRTLTNPVASTPESLERGKLLYQIHCAPCHGLEGQGNGRVSQKFFPSPDLRQIVPKRSDGYLYATIRSGGAIMPPYAVHLSPPERWDVVNYIRQLPQAVKR